MHTCGRRWVCEVREPQGQARIWLGTYPTPEMAARAHDVAAIALRGARAAALLNFPDSAAALPRARTAAPEDIRRAAAQAAELYRPRPGRRIVATTTTTTASSTPAPRLPALALPEAAKRAGTEEAIMAVFVDEDAIFDMPGLIDDMARGMLMTPPAMGGGLDWGAVVDEDDELMISHMDCTLWVH
ncbi:hypothetical protein ACP4OV_020013 [Aristida adscensionis]